MQSAIELQWPNGKKSVRSVLGPFLYRALVICARVCVCTLYVYDFRFVWEREREQRLDLFPLKEGFPHDELSLHRSCIQMSNFFFIPVSEFASVAGGISDTKKTVIISKVQCFSGDKCSSIAVNYLYFPLLVFLPLFFAIRTDAHCIDFP